MPLSRTWGGSENFQDAGSKQEDLKPSHTTGPDVALVDFRDSDSMAQRLGSLKMWNTVRVSLCELKNLLHGDQTPTLKPCW